MDIFNLGGAHFQSGLSVPSIGKAKGSSSLGLSGVGNVSANVDIDLSQGLKGLTGGVELTKDNGNVFTSGASKASHEDVSHQAISSYFIGPQAENMAYFRKNIGVLLDQLEKARLNYFPGDGVFITKDIQQSEEFKNRTEAVANATQQLGRLLGQHSVPFWSPRYQGHMCMDISMPSLLGYFTTMLYNPNNVAFEASPLSTLAEIEVGKQLCDMFGYNINVENESHPDPEGPEPWGHVTCDGTVANLESIWCVHARNLKFYPLSLRAAMEGPLSDVATTFKVRTTDGKEDLLINLSTWELLNLRVNTILDLPDRLNSDYGISSQYIETIMDQYGIQSRGKEALERQFGIEKTGQYFVSNTRHYSWPKGAAIAGIGSENMVGIHVDNGARLDVDELRAALEERLENKQAVYGVVAIVGSTEEGAVDPLDEIIALRDEYQEKGLSFIVHADAAWGGYFASMLPKDYAPDSGRFGLLPPDLGGPATGFVPDSPLRKKTQDAIWWLRKADSITVDPHKAGYIPYPAGGLCYRDGRLRHLLTWNAPYLSQGSTENIGVYGVEGSKPGASAVSTYMANACIGLDEKGYGALLGEVSFTCGRLAAQWAAMTDESMPFVVVPLNLLPSELAEGSTKESVEEEKEWIRNNILSSSNTEIVQNNSKSPGGDDAITLIRKLGSDLNINAFACNFRFSDGRLNTDPAEANYFNRRIVDHLSVKTPEDNPTEIPLYLTSTEFYPDLYGNCLKTFKERLGLVDGPQELFVLRNVVMSPFPTEKDFIGHLAGIFKEVAQEAVCRERNEATEAIHSFMMQGKDRIYILHKPSFHVANHRRQTLLEVELPSRARDWYNSVTSQHPDGLIMFDMVNPVDLNNAIENNKELYGNISLKSPEDSTELSDVSLKIIRPWLNRQLNGMYLGSSYPTDRMPFYLYGDSSSLNIDHALLASPNIQLSAKDIRLAIESSSSSSSSSSTNLRFENGRPYVLLFDSVREETMQPFPDSNKVLADLPAFFFRPGKEFVVSIWEDPTPEGASGADVLKAWEALGRDGQQTGLVSRGRVTLGDSVFVDAEFLNLDPYRKVSNVSGWTDEFKTIGKQLRK
ncbi:hypothetical protein M406DRAFT_85607 [Cryphonectria parasitica EP155]|uniref:Uncharacterized protein n=1 Tax=Cryphonectria parasitica (strain ATCC 38755 / EP155) TaxID=660469 RepID=A0A9P4XT13_CRYP1|nr:uncharacterized protein M406DRAFT_85607 [Cryphonectria parasitica EP155]KAF3760257.1 hypothetical protein M406DRAFT_85607 [Cryphonectria parasitica EP155]